jgi:hypothetical protein
VRVRLAVESNDCLERWFKIAVSRHDDADVVSPQQRHGHKVDGERNIDAFLDRTFARPVLGITEDTGDDRSAS